jgi:hypothetical protein
MLVARARRRGRRQRDVLRANAGIQRDLSASECQNLRVAQDEAKLEV